MIPLVRQVMTKEAFLNAPIWKKLLRTPNMVQNTYLGKMDARDQPSQKTNGKYDHEQSDCKHPRFEALLSFSLPQIASIKQSRLLPGPFLPKEYLLQRESPQCIMLYISQGQLISSRL